MQNLAKFRPGQKWTLDIYKRSSFSLRVCASRQGALMFIKMRFFADETSKKDPKYFKGGFADVNFSFESDKKKDFDDPSFQFDKDEVTV